MVISDLSIKRPVLATVFALVLVIFGLFSYRHLSVREYPDIDPPVVSVSTSFRGASAQIIESQITQIIEDAISGIDGIKVITSSSREDSSAVSIEFTLDRDIDAAANDVRDRISRVIDKLPKDADPPTVVKTETDAQPILWLMLSSDRMTPLELTDYAERNLVDRLSIVPGVASINTGGGQHYAMRIWLDREAMAARGLTVADIEDAINRQNVELPSGRIESSMREFSVRSETALKTAQQFRNIVVKEAGGYLVRLGEVAQVDLAAENDRTEMRVNGRVGVGVGIVRQSKANTLEVANAVKALLGPLNASLPPGLSLIPSYDQSLFIDRSIREVVHALVISMALVVGVIFLFLRSWRATMIPAVAIPVSIIASFTLLAALGYSVNVLTLLALVLAIGLVVDDAIVVLENIHRHIEEGEPPLLAALRGARQIGFAVIATTIVLIAVFVPISLLEGNTGRLFREFGISIAAAVAFSGFVALTLTPMMCSKWLREAKDEGFFYRATEPVFRGMAEGYRWLLTGAMRMPIVVMALAVAVSGIAALLYRALPHEFAPIEDRGVFFVDMQGPEGASLDYMRRYVQEIERRIKAHLMDHDGPVDRELTILAPSFGRPGPVNSAFMVARLRPWEERKTKQQAAAAEAYSLVRDVPGVRAYAINPPGLGQRGASAPVQVVIGGPSYDVLRDWADRLMRRAEANPKLLNLDDDYKETRPEFNVAIDRTRAADLGVSVETIGRTLETMLGSRFVTTFERAGKQYNVMVQARPEDRATPKDLSNIQVRSATTGKLIPLSNLVRLEEGAGARSLSRYDRLRAITVTASLAPGYTLGEALDYMEQAAHEVLPPDARISFSGQSRELKESSAALYLTFGLALLIVFLALAAQFESFIHPAIIMVSVPLAVTGALGSMLITGLTLNVYSEIGIVMLIGLTAKNAILIVEFANQLREAGQGIFDAVRDAAVIRLRPILMTTVATALGALPLALGTGAGAESRSTLGIVIIGGVGFSTILSLFVVPVLYLWLAGFTKPAGFIAKRLSSMESRHGHGEQPAE